MRWRQGGFTLVELAVILVIIAACVTVVFPKLSNGLLKQQRLKSSVSRIASVAEYTYQRAISTHLTHRLHINIEQRRYWVTAHRSEGSLVPIVDGPDLAGRLPEGIYFTGVEFKDRKTGSDEVVSIEFSPQGWIEPVAIYMATLEGRKMGVVMHEMSGSVETLEILE